MISREWIKSRREGNRQTEWVSESIQNTSLVSYKHHLFFSHCHHSMSISRTGLDDRTNGHSLCHWVLCRGMGCGQHSDTSNGSSGCGCHDCWSNPVIIFGWVFFQNNNVLLLCFVWLHFVSHFTCLSMLSMNTDEDTKWDRQVNPSSLVSYDNVVHWLVQYFSLIFL